VETGAPARLAAALTGCSAAVSVAGPRARR